MRWAQWVGLAALALGSSLGVAHAKGSDSALAAARFSISIDGYEIAGVTAPKGLVIEGFTDAKKEKEAVATKAPLALELDANVAEPLFAWMSKSFAAGGTARTTLVAGNEKRSVALVDAQITEINFPALDSSSKAPARIGIRIAPESVQYKKASGTPKGTVSTKAKNWLTSNFEVSGLPAPRVSKIESFTIKQGVKESAKVPGKLEFPNLTFTIPETDAAPWQKWLAAKTKRSIELTLTDTTGKRWARFALSGVELRTLKSAGKNRVATLGVGGAKLTR
jgi:hypothetical protein